MTLTLELPPEVEEILKIGAFRAGQSPEEFVTQLIQGDESTISPQDTVAFWLEDPYPIFQWLPDSQELARSL